MALVRAYYTDDSVTTNDFTLTTDTLDGSQNFHLKLQIARHYRSNEKITFLCGAAPSLGTENNARPAEVIGGELHRHFVAGKNTNVVHPHLS